MQWEKGGLRSVHPTQPDLVPVFHGWFIRSLSWRNRILGDQRSLKSKMRTQHGDGQVQTYVWSGERRRRRRQRSAQGTCYIVAMRLPFPCLPPSLPRYIRPTRTVYPEVVSRMSEP